MGVAWRALGVHESVAGIVLTVLPEWQQGGSPNNRLYEFVGGADD